MRYVRNCWYVVAWGTDLEPEKPLAVSVLGERIVIWQAADGNLSALEDRCVHRLAPLSLGRCEGANLRCMYHGFLYSRNGQVIEIPGQEHVAETARVKSYPVILRHSWIWVWMGDEKAADPSLIPPAVGYDNSDFILGHGQLDYAAEARLINDNLLDFSHLTYVHANSFGAGEDFANSQPDITRLERGIRFQRWTIGQPGPRATGPDDTTDNFMTYDFLLPGVLLMQSGSFDVGTAERLAFAPPDFEDAKSGVTFTSQAVTPLTEKTSRYFFSWGPRRDHGDEKMRDALMQLADVAFGEDKAIIEAQQRVIDDTPHPQILPTAHDRGIIFFNRLVERLCREEQNAAEAAE